MAQHTTRKNNFAGKQETMRRRAQRHASGKYAQTARASR